MEEQTYKTYETLFKKGTIVEVSSEDTGLRGSWYTATVIQTFSRKTLKIQVEYHTLMSDVSCSKPLKEYVPAILVRPLPPRETHLLYSLMDDVDAFHNDGWWEGVVTNIHFLEQQLSQQSHQIQVQIQPQLYSKVVYSVFFRCSREQIDFCPSDLRLHREWVPLGNLWVPPLDNHRERKRSGDGERNGYHSPGDKERVMMRDGRRSSNHFVSNGMVGSIRNDDKLRSTSNGACKNHGLTSNGNLKRKRISK